jgi:hypothetical protein
MSKILQERDSPYALAFRLASNLQSCSILSVRKILCKRFSKGENPMKSLGRFFAGIILALSLTLSTYAGHISCPGVTDEPPPQETATATEETVTGDIPNGIESTDTVTGLVISIFLDILPFV